MNSNFAKIFQSDTFGQILVKLDENDNLEPEIRFFFNPDQLGTCSVAVSFTNHVNCHSASRTLFDILNLEKAEGAVEGAAKQIQDSIAAKLSFTGEDL